MKVCVVQPEYSFDYSKSDELFAAELKLFDDCDESMDIIVFPEYSNIPCLAKTKEAMEESYNKYGKPLLDKAAEAAKRCHATLFVNCIFPTESGLRNTTLAFDKTGNLAGRYFKQHLVPSEMNVYRLDKDYTFEPSEPTVIEIDGIRYGFLVCYDFYFYEAFSNIARYEPDIIIACSHQRSDTHDALEMMSKFCAYNTNAYVVRSSVSLGKDSPFGGCSMIVAPSGEVLANMKNGVGFATAELNPHKRHLKPAGFGNPPDVHHHYIEAGRRPWKYRPSGSAVVRFEDIMPYPRVCAHRGFNTIAPKNSMPAFGAAIALGADEIEFDLWSSKDGVIVSIHDASLDRVSDGEGYVWEHTYSELLQYDFGKRHGEEFKGLTIPTFEDILKKFACHTVMNIHVKSRDDENPLPEKTVAEIIRLIKKYDCEKHVYFMSGNPAVLLQLKEAAPEIVRCAGAGNPNDDIIDKAIAAGAKKIQLFKPHFKHYSSDYVERMCERAHRLGIHVNMFYSDDADETVKFLETGVDTVLTNDYQRIADAVRKYKGTN